MTESNQPGPTREKAPPSASAAILGFLLRFAVLAPICLVLWWLLLPYYAFVLGHITRIATMPFMEERVESLETVRQGILNTQTLLKFHTGSDPRNFPVGLLVTNVAPFLALTLATSNIAWRRRLRILAIGVSILMATHALFMIAMFIWHGTVTRHPEIPTAIGQFFVALPFLLWITLAYRDRLKEWLAGSPSAKSRVVK